ncbi:MAG: PIN domain-containing protein [Chloroflexota bacterium]
MYLIDTDTISNLLKPRPSAALIVKVATVAVEYQFISSITLGELVYGAHRVPERSVHLLRLLDDLLLPNLRILPFEASAARHYGQVRADLERRGLPIGDADLRIAAVALVHNLTVVTRNIRHFERVPGLTVENWIE